MIEQIHNLRAHVKDKLIMKMENPIRMIENDTLRMKRLGIMKRAYSL